MALIATAWVLLCALLLLSGARDPEPSYCPSCPAYWTQQP